MGGFCFTEAIAVKKLTTVQAFISPTYVRNLTASMFL
jgi:hypothetical protein